MEKNSKGQAFLLLFVTFFIWGSVYVGGKLIAQDVPPALLACLRCVSAMIPLALMSRPYFHIQIDREDWKYFALVGLLGYFATIFCIQTGISMTGASRAALINALTPVSVTILAAIVLKEKITPITLVCLALALAGAAIITTGAGTQGESMGVVVVLISVVLWGLASVFMRRLTAKYPAVLVTTYGMAISLFGHIPMGLYDLFTAPEVNIDLRVVLVVLYLGFFGSGVAQFTWVKCLSALPASTCSLFYPLQPVFSALLGALLLKEKFTPAFFAGLLLISIDVALSTWETKRTSPS